MHPAHFWTSPDGQILTVKNKDERSVRLTLAFWPRQPAELEALRPLLPRLRFSLRSSLARIGLEVTLTGPIRVEGGRLELDAEAFLYDPSFPHAAYWKKLLRVGAPAGRLYHAPAEAKLTTAEIWDALKANQIKLPNTISIDSQGRVYLTPHQVAYTLNPKLQRDDLERVVAGVLGRSFLDRVQVRREAAPLAIAPRAGILTSCSMYLKEHYVVLNQGEGNFGIHTSAVLLDPVKTFGTNVMLEIYNPGDQPVVNPLVSVEVFRAPQTEDPEVRTLARKRTRLLATAAGLFKAMDDCPACVADEARPRTRLSVRGQSGAVDNRALVVRAGGDVRRLLDSKRSSLGHRTMIQALDAAEPGADTLITEYFPGLMEQVELFARLPELGLRRIVFRQASRTHGYFFSSHAHGRLDTLRSLGIDTYWYDETTRDLYVHTYKRERGFFVREEVARRFSEATIPT